MINKTQLKEFLHSNNMKLGGDVITALEEKVKELLKQGINRAKENQRKTFLGRDL